MTEIFVIGHGEKKQELKELNIVLAGEDGDYIWFDMTTVDGEKIQTSCFKEVN